MLNPAIVYVAIALLSFSLAVIQLLRGKAWGKWGRVFLRHQEPGYFWLSIYVWIFLGIAALCLGTVAQ